jgi:hypothetical protein
MCACVTTLFLSGEQWSLVQRYSSLVFVAFRYSTVRSIVIHLFVFIIVIKEDEVGGACGTHGGDEGCIQHFGWEA